MWRINLPQAGGGGGDGRESRGASQQSRFLFVAGGFVASSTVLHLLTLLPLSLPGLSGRSVGMYWPSSPQAERLVSLSLRQKEPDRGGRVLRVSLESESVQTNVCRR